jgi:hypothetical protein
MASGFDLTRTARSLLDIEVNTIIRDNMTAEPMPPLPHALIDIAQDYADAMSAMGVDMPRAFTGAAPGWVSGQAASAGRDLTIDVTTFDRLRVIAQWAAGEPDAGGVSRISGAQRVLLARIANNSDAIKSVIGRFPQQTRDLIGGKTRAGIVGLGSLPSNFGVSPDDLILLQKLWDIGVEEIVAQTVVHLTGDVVTRVQSVLRDPAGAMLFAIHRQSVDVAVDRWRSLLDAVREIAGTAVRTLLTGRG